MGLLGWMLAVRVRMSVALFCALLAIAAAQRIEPFVPMGVWYDPARLAASAVLGDLQAIRAAGFNHIRTSVRWASAEPSKGAYNVQPLDRLLTLTEQAGLRAILEPQIVPPPAWAGARPDDPAAVTAFVDAVSAQAARHRSFHSIDGFGAPFGIALYPRPAAGTPMWPVHLAWRLDAIRSAAGQKGWRIAELQAAPAPVGGAPAGVSAADVRLWTWTALARGARGITYTSWYPGAGTAAGLVRRDEALNEPARAAAGLAGLLSRNAALFAPMRPRPSKVAILYNPLWHAADFRSAAVAHAAAAAIYDRLFAWNVQADIVDLEAIVAGNAAGYAVVFVALPQMLPPAAVEALDAYVRAGGTVIDDPRQDLPAGAWPPDVRIDGGRGVVEARLLESAEALMLIGLNHAESAQTVTFTFADDVPEAIWQNMETGASVSFVRGRGGLTYRHAFAARDAMVLAIRKAVR